MQIKYEYPIIKKHKMKLYQALWFSKGRITPIYEVFISKEGRLYNPEGERIQLQKTSQGYPYIVKKVHGVERKMLCHRITAFTFFDYKDEEGVNVHHIGKKSDFSYDNIIVLDKDCHDILHRMEDFNSQKMKSKQEFTNREIKRVRTLLKGCITLAEKCGDDSFLVQEENLFANEDVKAKMIEEFILDIRKDSVVVYKQR